MIAFLIAAGIATLVVAFGYLPMRMPTAWLRYTVATAALGTMVMVGLAPVIINEPYCNLVEHRLAYDYGTEATAELQPSATVFVSGANIDFVLRGLQYCDEWRPDVRVINCDLMPSAWYRDWVFTNFPDLAAVPIPSDSTRLYLDRWAIALARTGAPVYWEFTETSMRMIYHLTPAGHFFHVSPDSVVAIDARMIRQQEDFERQSRFLNATKAIRRDFDAQRVYVSNLYRAGIFYDSRGHYDRARELFQRALTIHSDAGEKFRQGRSSGKGLSNLTQPAADSVTHSSTPLDAGAQSQ
jgi:tetratricopeptide (TPR) repeat protein